MSGEKVNLLAFFVEGIGVAFVLLLRRRICYLKHIGRLFEGTRPYARITG